MFEITEKRPAKPDDFCLKAYKYTTHKIVHVQAFLDRMYKFAMSFEAKDNPYLVGLKRGSFAVREQMINHLCNFKGVPEEKIISDFRYRVRALCERIFILEEGLMNVVSCMERDKESIRLPGGGWLTPSLEYSIEVSE